MRPDPTKFLEGLRVLTAHEVDFILVGGIAAILEGAPISTIDLDVLINSSQENLDRLLPALKELQARYFDPAGRTIFPDEGKLSTMKLHRLLTKVGPIDVMTSIGSGKSFQDLAPRAHPHPVEDLEVQVLELAAIIESKEAANRDKDRAVLGILRRTLELKEKSG